ncbi:MAG: iron ABC transporter permease [Methanospirillum sp.]|uniref:FecCD family ABC transporter permease n=1 Tax=Methanospirillum sp. TaxID=45200 RepID=UPI0023716FC3|nr:iron ABC transporter permease [Methanospirillum sp.]MDD1728813.1 iron ABC transporter permease [Methanospirillum sp.]
MEMQPADSLITLYLQSQGKRILFGVVLTGLLFVLLCISVTIGSAGLTPPEVALTIVNRLLGNRSDSFENAIVFGIRLHRVIFGACAGFGLAVCGAVMQGILRNPLASPFTLGISSAAAFGASIAIIFGTGIGLWTEGFIVTNAFIFTLLATFGIYLMAKRRGMTAETMVLAGILIMYLFSAMTSFLQFFASAEHNQEIVFWTFGSLTRTSWEKTEAVVAILLLTIPYLLWRSWDINALSEGDEIAKGLGVLADRTRGTCMMIVSVITAGIICFTGTIGFIGLVAPHISRMLIGADMRYLIPISGLIGAMLLTSADILSRSLIPDQIIPVGIMTAFIGIPFFGYLFMKVRREYW